MEYFSTGEHARSYVNIFAEYMKEDNKINLLSIFWVIESLCQIGRPFQWLHVSIRSQDIWIKGSITDGIGEVYFSMVPKWIILKNWSKGLTSKPSNLTCVTLYECCVPNNESNICYRYCVVSLCVIKLRSTPIYHLFHVFMCVLL